MLLHASVMLSEVIARQGPEIKDTPLYLLSHGKRCSSVVRYFTPMAVFPL